MNVYFEMKEYYYALTLWFHTKSQYYLFDAMIFLLLIAEDSVQLYRCKYDECDVLLCK